MLSIRIAGAGVGLVRQQVKALAVYEPDKLSSIPGTHRGRLEL